MLGGLLIEGGCSEAAEAARSWLCMTGHDHVRHTRKQESICIEFAGNGCTLSSAARLRILHACGVALEPLLERVLRQVQAQQSSDQPSRERHWLLHTWDRGCVWQSLRWTMACGAGADVGACARVALTLMAARSTGLETLSAIPARGATRMLLRVRPVALRRANAVLLRAWRRASSVWEQALEACMSDRMQCDHTPVPTNAINDSANVLPMQCAGCSSNVLQPSDFGLFRGQLKFDTPAHYSGYACTSLYKCDAEFWSHGTS